MEEKKTWITINAIGNKIQNKWKELAASLGLKINVNGIPSLANFSFPSARNQLYKTLITQEMLKKGFLASNSVYLCLAHDDYIIDEYFEHLNELFSLIKKCEDGKSVDSLLNGPVCHSGFERLN